jgi:hypothetical protein
MKVTEAETWGSFSELDLEDIAERSTRSSAAETEEPRSDLRIDEDLAATIARLIRTHPAVRRAVLGVVMSCPNAMREV